MEDLDVGNDFAPDDWDDDDQGDADVQQPRRRKNYLTLWEKKDIVEEAYAAPRRVKATARKYGVQPKQIRRWRINAKEENVIVLQHGGVEVEFIPSGYTAVLQVLDKGVHRSFKHFYRENCINWLTQQQLPNAKPTRILVARWIRDAWERVTAVSIINTWNSLPLHPFEPE